MKVPAALAASAALLALAGCRQKPAEVKPPPAAPLAITFTDVTAASGIRFVHNAGETGKKWFPETMGAGVACLDYDGDGWPDVYFVNGRDWTDAERRLGKLPPAAARKKTTGHLYRNRHDGTFEDVTERAGLAVETYGMGVCVGDYDNDGHPDLYVTGLGGNHLFRNRGDGTFEDVTAKAGVGDKGWSTSACFVDYNKDGRLDLFVCHYVKWTPDTDIFCRTYASEKDYCRPTDYHGEPCRLFRNDGNGHFTDVSDAAALHSGSRGPLQGKSLGVTVCDYNDDGWPDIALANDTEPNYLFENNKNGTFTEVGARAGIAFDDTGSARGAMGIDAADFNHTGRDSLLIGNFANQMIALYGNQGHGLFIDSSQPAGVGQPSLLSLVFGCFFVDVDNDGWPDIFTANGHVEDDIEKVQQQVKREERPLLFHNLGPGQKGKFAEIGEQAGLHRPLLARGAARADFDLDGDEDVVISTNRGPAVLYRNDGGNRNNSLRIELEGAQSNRSAIGTWITAKVLGDTRRCSVRSGSSYLSQSELPLELGLGGATQLDSLEIRWPSGTVTQLSNLPANQVVRIKEGQGIVSQAPLPGKSGKPVQAARS